MHRRAASREVLFRFGNMSSATLPHVWTTLVNDASVAVGTPVVSLAFGPGLTMCGALMIGSSADDLVVGLGRATGRPGRGHGLRRVPLPSPAGLGAWERIGHPLDTSTVLACLGWVLFAPTQRSVEFYVLLALVSCSS